MKVWQRTWPAAHTEAAERRIRAKGEYRCQIEDALALAEGDVPAKDACHETTVIYKHSDTRQEFICSFATVWQLLKGDEIMMLPRIGDSISPAFR